MTLRLSVIALAMAVSLPAHAGGICDRKQPCDDTAQTTVENGECANNLAKEADKKLNSLWPKVLSLYDGQTNEKQGKDDLQQAQRTWIKFRDETCNAEYDLGDQGTISSILAITCTCAVTESRIADFERMIQYANP